MKYAVHVLNNAQKLWICKRCERVAMYQPKLIKHLLTHNCETGQPVGEWGLGLGCRAWGLGLGVWPAG